MGNHLPTMKWEWRSQDDTLTPVETDLAVAPDTLPNMVSCGCKEGGCGSMSCGCKKLGMFCTSVCTKCKGETCSNTTPVSLDEDEDTAPTLLNIDVNDEDDNETQP